MNWDETIADKYLRSLTLGNVVYEPDGKVPPDFLVDGRIAVEARRLSKHYEIAGEVRSLEQDIIPMRQAFVNILDEFGAPADQRSWFVMFNFRRPLAEWKVLRNDIRTALKNFLHAPADGPWRIPLTGHFNITLIRSTEYLGKRFVHGGNTDMDAGGWVVSDIITNMPAYIAEKTAKVAPYRNKYSSWWLVFIDYIGTPSDEAEVRKHLQHRSDWDRVIVLNPSSGKAYDI